jgi:predicted nucleotide-binding protein (sugar kinase/HSP70/actin superfamily)
LFKTFFEALGASVLLSPKTNKEILKSGIEHSPAEICLPVKAFLGHIAYLKDKVDYLFIPRIVCIKDSDVIRFGCPKAISLPDLVRATFDKLPPILELNWDERVASLKASLSIITKTFPQNGRGLNLAYQQAQQVQITVDQFLQQGMPPDRIFEDGFQLFPSLPVPLARQTGSNLPSAVADKKVSKAQSVTDSITVGIVGHPYLLYDDELSLGIVDRLKSLGVSTITPTMLPSDVINNSVSKFNELSWIYEQAILGSAAYFLNGNGVDGLLLVSSFACGTGAVVNEIIHREIARVTRTPILMLLLDEHTAETGIMTRLESFIDLISLSKEKRINRMTAQREASVETCETNNTNSLLL